MTSHPILLCSATTISFHWLARSSGFDVAREPNKYLEFG